MGLLEYSISRAKVVWFVNIISILILYSHLLLDFHSELFPIVSNINILKIVMGLIVFILATYPSTMCYS